jgi:hypothetical protein
MVLLSDSSVDKIDKLVDVSNVVIAILFVLVSKVNCWLFAFSTDIDT